MTAQMAVRESCGNPGAVLAAGAGGEIHTTLLGIPSVFERLIYIGSLVKRGAGHGAVWTGQRLLHAMRRSSDQTSERVRRNR